MTLLELVLAPGKQLLDARLDLTFVPGRVRDRHRRRSRRDFERALDLCEPCLRGHERSLGLAPFPCRKGERGDLRAGRLERGLRLVVFLELLLELRDPLAGCLQVGGENLPLVQLGARRGDPVELGLKAGVRVRLPRLGRGNRTGALLELPTLVLERREHPLECTGDVGVAPADPGDAPAPKSHRARPPLQLPAQRLYLALPLRRASRALAQRRLEARDLVGRGHADPVALGSELALERAQPRELGGNLRRGLGAARHGAIIGTGVRASRGSEPAEGQDLRGREIRGRRSQRSTAPRPRPTAYPPPIASRSQAPTTAASRTIQCGIARR